MGWCWGQQQGRARAHLQQHPAGLQLGGRVRVGPIQPQQLLKGPNGLGIALGPSGERG